MISKIIYVTEHRGNQLLLARVRDNRMDCTPPSPPWGSKDTLGVAEEGLHMWRPHTFQNVGFKTELRKSK